jgi:hypothetical protein
MPACLPASPQDVGDERSRTEAEFFQYTAQVGAGLLHSEGQLHLELPARNAGAGAGLPRPAHEYRLATRVLPVCTACLPLPQVYRFFMTGDDSKCEEVDGRQAAEFEARAAGIQSDTQRLQAVSAPVPACVCACVIARQWGARLGLRLRLACCAAAVKGLGMGACCRRLADTTLAAVLHCGPLGLSLHCLLDFAFALLAHAQRLCPYLPPVPLAVK